jgi:hypothetical protein
VEKCVHDYNLVIVYTHTFRATLRKNLGLSKEGNFERDR